MMVAQKTLYILRHAKTETGGAAQDDRTRELTQRGVEATKIVGKYMLGRNVKPDKVLCSPAIRTTETLFKIEHTLKHPLPVEYIEGLYLASAAEMLNIIANVDDGVTSLLVVAHNPGVHELCMKLAKAGDEKLIDKMAIKFPTCAIASFSCPLTSWTELRHVRTVLVDFVSPKMLGQEIVG